ncbi:MAG: hypothetical protein A2X18_04965 [Bacteroidetes bacterium GWF2_40_14]|nr:MAG: hypothetical protein A2X18_04965 [Bacteroidetes bacterium GWF2_40_14]
MNNASIRILLFLFFLSAGKLFSQDHIKGVVVSKDDGTVISNAQVCIYDSEGKNMLGYTFSLKDGTFNLKPAMEGCFFLEVSSMGFAKNRIRFDQYPVGTLKIELARSDFQLKEVTIKAPKVSEAGDTLNYLTAGFVREQDRSIGDVLKRLPGIDVTKSGLVTLNDKPINALYIDGKNLLDGKYGIATQNINPDIVSLIQIFKNHQPVKVLQNTTTSENAAINLILNPKAKGEWIMSADLGVGASPFLWNSALLLFQFNKNVQSMNVVKGNNAGMNIRGEVNEQNLGSAAESQIISNEDKDLLKVTGKASPPIGEQRDMFNQSLLISSNSLFYLAKDIEGVVKLNYLYDLQERWQNERTEYIIEGSENIAIQENNSYRGLMHSPELDIVIKSNTPRSFIQNRINGSLRFCNNIANTTGTKSINQSAGLRQYDFSEIFTFIKPVKKSILRVSSNTQIKSLPQSLTIATDDISQVISLFQVQSNNSAGIIIPIGRFSADIKGGANITYQKLESDLTGFNEKNSVRWFFTELFVIPSLKYENEALRITAKFPLKLQNGMFRVTPGLALRYKFSPFWEGWITYDANNSQTDILNMNPSMVLMDYRSIYRGYNKMLASRIEVISARAQYSNPLKLVNLYGAVNYNRNMNGYTVSMQYEDFYNVRTILPEQRESSGLSLLFSATKSFFDLPLLLDIKSNCTIADNSMIQQGADVKFRTLIWSAVPKIEATLFNSLEIALNTKITVSKRTAFEGGSSSFTRTDYNPALLLSYRPKERFRSQIKFDCYINELANGVRKNFLFTDIKIAYKIGGGELTMDWTNIFNKREYRFSYFSELTNIEREFRLRPGNIMLGYSFTL